MTASLTRLIVCTSLLVGEVTSFSTRSWSSKSSNVNLYSSSVNEESTEAIKGAQLEAQSDEKEETVYYNILSEETSMATTIPGEDVMSSIEDPYSDFTPINGWVPKPDFALWGLPGAIAPLGFFDPIGFAREGLPLNDAKRLREAEVQHSRVAMLACVGYIAGEAIQGPFHITGPANDQLQQVPGPAFWFLTVGIAAAELYRATVGWVEPQFKIGSKTLWTLRDNYYPGDIGFDPLNLKPTENYEFQRMQTMELSNGRLAMIGWAGMCAQELINHRTIAETIEFYQILFSGGNPYTGY